MAGQLPEQIIGAASFVQRQSLCLPGPTPGEAVHSGDHEFAVRLRESYTIAENNATEALVELKKELRAADTETFWKRLMQGMTDISNAQYGFVAKRILVNDEDSAVEMPHLGEEGSCLMGVAFYLNQETGNEQLHRDYKYVAWGAPCAHMRHEKVFLVPNRMSRFITDNPNKFPVEPEAYIGIPLFSEGKCFAHFGLLWTEDGLAKRGVSWGFLEMMLHALEDMIQERIVAGGGELRQAAESISEPQIVKSQPSIPQRVIPASLIGQDQSLKPYAKSLSHELRTPMQGVVGMLDVMHATVDDALHGSVSRSKIPSILLSLRDNIEMVQDSAKRAVEAADNVVHAYDLNMQIPETPMDGDGVPVESMDSQLNRYHNDRSRFLIEGSVMPVNAYKRKRLGSSSEWTQDSSHPQHRAKLAKSSSAMSPRSASLRSAVMESNNINEASPSKRNREAVFNAVTDNNSRPPLPVRSTTSRIPTSLDTHADNSSMMTPSNLRQTNLRELLNVVIHESLQVGGRPESAVGELTSLGEKVEVRVKHSSGEISTNVIEVTIDPNVPETLLVDERDLAKLVSCVFLNAMKFTEDGKIDVVANLSPAGKYVVITVRDTGRGIPADFLPNIFKPFAREDDSITRSKEGLGLGLLVAKGLSRKIGGDLICSRSSTSGPDQGSEFAISIPLTPVDPATSPIGLNRTPSPGSPQSESEKSVALALRKKLQEEKEIQASKPAALQNSPPREFKIIQSDGKENGGMITHQRTTSAGSIRTPKAKKSTFDRNLSEKYPLTFLVAEDNRINRKLLVNMLNKLGYKDIYEAFDGREAVRVMTEVLDSASSNCVSKTLPGLPDNKALKPVDMILMDLWMPEMDGYEATQRIRELYRNQPSKAVDGPLTSPTVLAVSADVTDEAMSRAARVGMEGFMTKPYKIPDLQRLIVDFCGRDK